MSFKWKELKAEWKRIVWPTKKELAQKTGLVIVFCAVFSAIIGLFDFVFYKLRTLIQGIFVK